MSLADIGPEYLSIMSVDLYILGLACHLSPFISNTSFLSSIMMSGIGEYSV
jgi:hypothetical protein